MAVMKLFSADWIQNLAILAGHVAAIIFVLGIMGNHLQREEIRTKRAFKPTSLVGTMEPVSSGD